MKSKISLVSFFYHSCYWNQEELDVDSQENHTTEEISSNVIHPQFGLKNVKANEQEHIKQKEDDLTFDF